jgi:hypothetical protein
MTKISEFIRLKDSMVYTVKHSRELTNDDWEQLEDNRFKIQVTFENKFRITIEGSNNESDIVKVTYDDRMESDDMERLRKVLS